MSRLHVQLAGTFSTTAVVRARRSTTTGAAPHLPPHLLCTPSARPLHLLSTSSVPPLHFLFTSFAGLSRCRETSSPALSRLDAAAPVCARRGTACGAAGSKSPACPIEWLLPFRPACRLQGPSPLPCTPAGADPGHSEASLRPRPASPGCLRSRWRSLAHLHRPGWQR